MVIELRPPLPVDKGTAVAQLVRRLGLRAAMCLGDDVTDLDMFETVKRLRENEGFPALTVGVASEETSPQVLEATDYYVQGVPGVERLLEELAGELTARPSSGPETGTPAST